MSDWFYKLVLALGWPAFFINGRPTILHRERARRKGAYILAPTHFSEYDVPLLMTVPNAFGSESFDWVDDLITNPIRMKDGYAYPHPKPGWGFSFKDEFLSELR